MTQRYDPQARRRSKRAGRERGCWIYIAAVELERAGFAGADPPPFYRAQSFRRGTVLVNLFPTERPPAAAAPRAERRRPASRPRPTAPTV